MVESSKRIHPELPIFELVANNSAVLYTPGHVARVRLEDLEAMRKHFNGEASATGRLSPLARALCARAAEAEERWLALSQRPFAPECLTVYLSNHCNLGCVYCYSAGPNGSRDHGWEGTGLPLVDPRAVEAAARIVAANCAQKGKPFHLVLHGGGEPTLHWHLLQEVIDLAGRVARQFGLDLKSYISTSGVLSDEKARWLAANVSKIGLSIDGPPEIQTLQRPSKSGSSTWPSLERTARILRTTGVPFCVRSTITRDTLQRQAEIVAYLHSGLGAREFTFEPAYRQDPHAKWALNTGEDARRFVDHFLAAQRVAELLGCDLSISGVRLDEIHGPYCNVLRDVLQVLPDATATSCFVCTDGAQPQFAEHQVGRWDPADNAFVINHTRAAELRELAVAVPTRCRTCHNIYHCARDCPDFCPLPRQPDLDAEGGFRCKVQQLLGRAWILGSMDETTEDVRVGPGEIETAVSCLAQAPDNVSAFDITNQWLAVRRRYDLSPRRAPDPVWALRAFDMDGEAAWAEISGPVVERMGSSPISVYVHIPFCDRKCDFCDCYSLAVKNGATDFRMRQYTQAVLREIEAWAGLSNLTRRHVTTVHFGGGTPSFLDPADMRAIVDGLKANLNTSASTEWALESTTTELTPASMEQLQELGFTRLHVGVQTLEEPVRHIAGRKESALVVEEKLRAALALGMVVTADVIYGLPRQTLAGFVDTLERLDQLGIHGVSLYKLNVTIHNRPFARQHRLGERNPCEGFFMFQIGESFLRARGYRKSHFAHFSRPEDSYLYYTHVRRGEDLLAIGATADGSFASTHYRNPGLAEYLRILETGVPVLAGACNETRLETALQPATACLMTASLPISVVNSLGVEGLVSDWVTDGLLRRDSASNDLHLTAAGSCLINDMLEELAEATAGMHTYYIENPKSKRQLAIETEQERRGDAVRESSRDL